MKRISLRCLVAFSFVIASITKTQEEPFDQKIHKKMLATYEWFNYVVNPRNNFDPAALKDITTPDFVWRSSVVTWAYDYASLCDLINELRSGDFLLIIDLPFKEFILSEDQTMCVVRYTVEKRYCHAPLRKEYVIAIWEIASDGRLCRLHEVACRYE